MLKLGYFLVQHLASQATLLLNHLGTIRPGHRHLRELDHSLAHPACLC